MWSRRTHRAIRLFVLWIGASAIASAAPPEFAIRPVGDEQAFVDSVYKAVIVATGCPEPEIVIDSPAAAIFDDDTLTYVPTGDVGDTFRVRVRAVNPDGEAVADYGVTLVDELRLDFGAGSEFLDFFEPRLEDVPASQLAELNAEVRGGRLEIDVPRTGEGPTDNLDSWCGFDRSPRWWSKLRVFGAFAVETRLALKAADNGDPSYGYHVGLAFDRDKEDLLIQGVIRDRVEYERTCRRDGDFTLLNFFPGSWSQAVSLKIVVSGKRQSFWARRYDSDPWMRIGSIWDARPALRGMGLAIKTWADQTAFTASFSYFRFRGLTAEPPEIIAPEGDHAFSGGEYCRRLDVLSDLPASLAALTPAGASIDPTGLFTYDVSEPPGASFEASVRATSDAGDDTRAWRVQVERPVKLEFDREEDFTGEFFDPGTDQSTRRGEIITRVGDSQLQIVLPEAGENDFDSWCGYDRSPRWLHRARVTGSYVVEALVSFHTPPPLLPEGYHAGLAVDRGHQDLALLGAIREGVEYERTCSKGCENTGTFFPGQWSKADEKFFLRIEARCDEQVFLARPESDPDWTIIANVEGRRPAAVGVGVGLKNWANQGLFATAYDSFEYGPLGCGFTEVPEDAEVLAGSTYRARVQASGVHPIYSLSSPAGATIDPETGEIEYHVAAGTPGGTTIDFNARVACGLNVDTASWTLTVTVSEPPVQVTSVTPRVFSSLGKTPFVVRGANFTPQSGIIIGAATLDTEFVSSSELRALAPVHAPAMVVFGRVRDPGRGEASFIVSYVGPFAIDSIAPDAILAGQESWIDVTGVGFTPDTEVKVAQQSLDLEYLDVYTLRARVPGLDPGPYDVAVVDQNMTGQWFTDSLSDGLTVIERLELTSVSPAEVSCLGRTPIEIRGAGFSEATTVYVEDLPLPVEFVDATNLRSTAPAHAAGAATLVAIDPVTGRDELAGALSYVCGGGQGLELESITPDRMTTGVPIEVEIRGNGFTPETGIRFAAEYLTNKVVIDARTIRGRTPPLAAGVYYIQAVDRDAGGQIVTDILQEQPFVVSDPVEPPAVLTRVEPHEIPRSGGTQVSVIGERFIATTQVAFGAHPLMGQRVESDTLITGIAPGLDIGEPLGLRDVFASDERGTATLLSGVTYVEDPPPPFVVPGPAQVEGAIAEGLIRYRWYNPVDYREIMVLDENDEPATVVDRNGNPVPSPLPGTTQEVFLPQESRREARHRIQGVTPNDEFSRKTDAFAAIHDCSAGVRVTPRNIIGDFEFTLFGAHDPAEDRNPCGGDTECWLHGECATDSLWSFYEWNSEDPMQLFEQTGRIRTAAHLVEIPDRNKVITGFTLKREALKLEIGAYYQKTAPHPGGSLRGRLTLVEPFEPGVPLFDTEFTFPNILSGKPKAWNSAIVSRECEGADYRPPQCPDKEPADILPIPAGDYLLEIYAVGGDSEPYYLFGSDQHDEPKLIPGVPCPPYPAVEVTDVTGSDSLPEMDSVDAVAVPTTVMGVDLVWATFQFRGEWKDACGVPHPIPSDDPADQNPSFQYEWVIHDKPPIPPVTSNTDSKSILVWGWKCYYVTVTVRDLTCGTSREYNTQVSVYPQDTACPAGRYHDFLFPNPDPGGIYGVAGLDPPPGGPGRGEFQSARMVEFKVMVVPRCVDGQFTPATGEDIRFELVTTNPPSILAASNPSDPEGASELMKVFDRCGDVEAGKPKYFVVRIEDLGRLPSVFLNEDFKDVRFQAISLRYREPNGASHPVPGPQTPVPIGQPFHMTNSPPCLQENYWSGYFDEKDESYHFTVKISPESQVEFADSEMRYSRELPLPIDVPGGVSIPSLESRLNVGFVSRFRMQNGSWMAEPATGMTAGLVISNELDGAPLDVQPFPSAGGGLGADGGGAQLLEPYRWCHHEPILRGGFRQTLVETLLFAGAIGPVPVEMWGTIELGMDYGVDAYVDATVSPFAAMGEGSFVENHFYLKSNVDVYLPCGVRADVLFGVFSVAARMVPNANFQLDAHVGVIDGATIRERYVAATLDLYLEAEACVDLLFWDECWGKTVTLLRDEPLFGTGFLNRDIDPTACGALAIPGGGGERLNLGQPTTTFSFYVEESAPATAVSPDGETTLDAYVDIEGKGVVVFDDDVKIPVWTHPDVPFFHKVRDPAAAFLANDTALVAFTRTFPDYPDPPADPQSPTLLERDALAAIQDIYVYRYHRDDVAGWREDELNGQPVAVSDLSDAPLGEKRADGRPDLAAAYAASDPWAMLAWVRYETFAFFADDGFQTMLQPQFNPLLLRDEVKPAIVRAIRPRLEQTAIYARRLSENGTAIDAVRSISPAGINVEPTLAILPAGEITYCVWVHDSTPGHENLIDSNLGRRLLYSVYSSGNDEWSSPADAVQDPDAYPGILEPSIAIRRDEGGNIDGILAFTAMAEGTPENHTGLYGSGRFIFISYLENGVFGEPTLLHERCAQRAEGHWVTVTAPAGGDLAEVDGSHFKKPWWIISWQSTGPLGSPLGSGGVMASVLPPEGQRWTDARSLTPLGQLVSNTAMAGGPDGIRTIHLDGGDARMEQVAMRLALEEPPTFRAMSTNFQPDLAVMSCTLADPFLAPGQTTSITIEIENQGLSGSALDESGASVVQLKATVFDTDGSARDEIYFEVPEIAPGESTKMVLEDVELMLDPTRVLLELDPNPGDSNPSNDTCELYMGVPPPEDVRCNAVVLPDEERRLVAQVRWRSPLEYEQIDLYRDGQIIVILPGTSTMYVDLYVEPGEHAYEVRGRIRNGKSLRIESTCVVEPPIIAAAFRRGDVDGNSTLEITDAVVLLSYLYLGGPAPACPDAADADDNASLEITDPIRILGYLFLGSAPPPLPGPLECGPDPTTGDSLGECVYTCP